MEMEVPVETNLGSGSKMFGFSTNSSRSDSMETTSEVHNASIHHQHKLPHMVKYAVIGESTSGKTALCEAFCNGNFNPSSKYYMTCSVQIYGKSIKLSSLTNPERKSDMPDDTQLNLILLDSSGKSIYREYLPKYWDKLDGFILVLDLTSSDSLTTATDWLDLAKGSLNNENNSKKSGSKMGLLIGTKSDGIKVIPDELLKELSQKNNLEYFECSVRNNIGIQEPFEFIVQQWSHGHMEANGGPPTMYKGKQWKK